MKSEFTIKKKFKRNKVLLLICYNNYINQKLLHDNFPI